MQAEGEDAMTPEWAQVWATVARSTTQTLIGIGLIAITWNGLKQMREASAERNQQLDDQHLALMELLKRTEH